MSDDGNRPSPPSPRGHRRGIRSTSTSSSLTIASQSSAEAVLSDMHRSGPGPKVLKLLKEFQVVKPHVHSSTTVFSSSSANKPPPLIESNPNDDSDSDTEDDAIPPPPPPPRSSGHGSNSDEQDLVRMAKQAVSRMSKYTSMTSLPNHSRQSSFAAHSRQASMANSQVYTKALHSRQSSVNLNPDQLSHHSRSGSEQKELRSRPTSMGRNDMLLNFPPPPPPPPPRPDDDANELPPPPPPSYPPPLAKNISIPLHSLLQPRHSGNKSTPTSPTSLSSASEPLNLMNEKELKAQLISMKDVNNTLDRWGDLIQQESEYIQRIVELASNAAVRLPSPQRFEKAPSSAADEQQLKSLVHALSGLQHKLKRERAKISKKTASLVFAESGTHSTRPRTQRKSSGASEYWEESEPMALCDLNRKHDSVTAAVYCFNALRTHRIRESENVVVRVHTGSLRLVLSSEAWASHIEILGEHIINASQPVHNRRVVNVVVRQRSQTETESFVFPSVVFARQFLRLMLQFPMRKDAASKDAKFGSTSESGHGRRRSSTGIRVQLAPEHVDLVHAIADTVRVRWRDDTAKSWLKQALQVVNGGLKDQRLELYTTGTDALGPDIAAGYADLVLKALIHWQYSIVPVIQGKPVPSMESKERNEVVQYLAKVGHSHWVKIYRRLQALALKGMAKDQVPAQPGDVFRDIPFEELTTQETQQHCDDADAVVCAIFSHGFTITALPNRTMGRRRSRPCFP